MPLLRNGSWVDDNPWLRLEDTDDLPAETAAADTPIACSLARFLALAERRQYPVSGVWLKSDDDVMALEPHLDHIQLIVIDFPVYTDGRGYTQARLLRKQLMFAGELRAAGDVRPDQLLFMARAGIDTFAFSEQPDTALVESILSNFTVNYQPSYSLPIAG